MMVQSNLISPSVPRLNFEFKKMAFRSSVCRNFSSVKNVKDFCCQPRQRTMDQIYTHTLIN